MDFSLDSYFKLRKKREIEKQEDDVFDETSIELLTQSPEKRRRRRRASWERNLKMYRCPMDNALKLCVLLPKQVGIRYISNIRT